MSPRITFLALALTIISRQLGSSANSVNEKNAEPRSISLEEAVQIALFTPAPHYPYKAREKHLEGSALMLLTVNRQTGYVTSARILKSTGHQILDDEALKAYKAWRFKPGTVSAVRIPVTFGLSFKEWARSAGHSLWLRNATYWLLPEYPREAREKGITGKGVAVVKIDPGSGYVTSASMIKSTGHKILDSAAILAFRQWRFKPRTVTTLEIPIQFTPKGVFY